MNLYDRSVDELSRIRNRMLNVSVSYDASADDPLMKKLVTSLVDCMTLLRQLEKEHAARLIASQEAA